MHGRGSSRFGKYGDLKRKERIRQNLRNQKNGTLTSLMRKARNTTERFQKGTKKK